MSARPIPKHRILVIDDNPAIHDDFRKILQPESPVSGQLGAAAAALFGRDATRAFAPRFEINCASSGQEGLAKVRAAAEEGLPYAMAYVDVRMPNGWDGIETISRIWQEYGDLLVVICTAFSDHSWEEIQARLGENDRFLILKKPFDNLEVRQLTFALAERARTERELAISQRRLAAEGVMVQRLGSDIPAMKRIEDELRKAHDEAARANETLRAEINERMRAELALQSAKEVAEKASLAKSEFLSRVSHELRTPMNAILGFGQLLAMEKNLSEDQGESVGEILKGGRHLLDLINKMLDISRIEAGRMTLSAEAAEILDALASGNSLHGAEEPAMADGEGFEPSYVGPSKRGGPQTRMSDAA